MKNNKIDIVIEAFRHYIQLKEMTTMGSGQIAGSPESDPGNPPVFPGRKKTIYLRLGSRSRWMPKKPK
jgi:hypothetical protein